jgi:rhodanese-related sulfurtransferase
MKIVSYRSFAARVLMALVLWPCISLAADSKPDEVFNFGKGTLGSEVRHDFHLLNSGTSRMSINQVKTSCPCTRIVAFPKTIAPGQIGIISIATKLDQTGNKDVLVTAIPDGKAEAHIFVIKGEITGSMPIDPDLFIEPKKLLGSTKPEILYIDVRPNIAFDEARIPASLNMPLFELKARTYLKSRPLVIVGTGIDDAALVATVEACLKERFISVQIMRGGIRQWQQAGGRLEGVLGQRPPLDKITASQLLSGVEHSPWLMLVPKGAEGKVKVTGLPQAQIIFYDDIKSVEKIAKATLALNTALAGVAVFAASDRDQVVLSRHLPSIERPLFVVSEPWAALTALAMAAAKSSEGEPVFKTIVSGPLTHRIIGCPTCP